MSGASPFTSPQSMPSSPYPPYMAWRHFRAAEYLDAVAWVAHGNIAVCDPADRSSAPEGRDLVELFAPDEDVLRRAAQWAKVPGRPRIVRPTDAAPGTPESLPRIRLVGRAAGVARWICRKHDEVRASHAPSDGSGSAGAFGSPRHTDGSTAPSETHWLA